MRQRSCKPVESIGHKHVPPQLRLVQGFWKIGEGSKGRFFGCAAYLDDPKCHWY